MTSTTITTGGSTEAEINLLEKTYSDLKPGMKITYEALENMLKIQRHSNRWISVMTRWRRILEDRSVILTTIRNEGYVVSTNVQKLDASSKSLKQGYRRIFRAGKIANITGAEGLSDEQIRTRDHHRGISAQLQAALMVAPRAIE